MPMIRDDELKRQLNLINCVIEGNCDVWRSDFYLKVVRAIFVGLDLFLEGGVLRVKVGDLFLELLDLQVQKVGFFYDLPLRTLEQDKINRNFVNFHHLYRHFLDHNVMSLFLNFLQPYLLKIALIFVPF